MKKTYIFFASLLIFIFVCSCNAKEIKNIEKNEVAVNKKKSYISVSMEQGLKMMSSEDNFILLDVRRDDEYASGHIPGAILLTNETMTKSETEKIIPNKEIAVFVYCRSGRRSKEAAKKLVDYGYTNVTEIGGILDYSGKTEK